ncbi:MAG: hypothetical protein C4520_08600 [Candidatus Abyssobacteria bacterium SURF_5]|uniref:Response regulator n=1 Tax=Abyssobacteria bacterium (strain SURF_5) TaxID=2093360 RepID=A0A3A4NP66_ABYX5|nr:MAG: hypothetical protein C4520_08600 [Candidatus Abyssubacteria bacterium SURF_5]
MKKQSNILLVSANPDLHRTLEIVASTCSSRFFGAENAKKGMGLLVSSEMDCVIFDLATLPNPRHKQVVRRKIEKAGVPTLWLNDGSNGNGGSQGSQKIEPIVKFVMDTCERVGNASNGNFLRRFFSVLHRR